MNKENLLFNPTDSYILGNNFRNLYKPYKNYKPSTLTPSNDKERLFLKLSEISFSMHELNLYLDTHPNDRMIQKLFMDYQTEYNKLCEMYQQRYEVLETKNNNIIENDIYKWVEQNFPWTWRDTYYV